MRKSKMKIAAIIPYFNQINSLQRLLKQLEHEKVEKVIVVDNSSQNRLKPSQDFHLISLPPRVGFTEAVNEGLSSLRDEDGVWILNQDVEIIKGLEGLLKGFSLDTAVVSSLVVDIKKQDFVTFGGGLDPVPGVHLTGALEKFEGKIRETSWVTFCSVLISRAALRKVGMLDPNFLMICSDSDFCFRARSFGFKIKVSGFSVVAHDDEKGFSRVANQSKDPWRMSVLWHDSTFFQYKYLGGLFNDLKMSRF